MLVILTVQMCILHIDTVTIFAVTVKISCLIINCISSGKKFQNVMCSLFVCLSDIDLLMIYFVFLSLLERDFKKHDDRNWNRRDAGRGRGRGGPMMYVHYTGCSVWFKGFL